MIVAEKQFHNVELHRVKKEGQRQENILKSDMGEHRKTV